LLGIISLRLTALGIRVVYKRAAVLSILLVALPVAGHTAPRAAQTPRVPQGAIFSTLPVAASVLAGDDTNILVTYRVVTPPFSGVVVSTRPSLQAIVDLLDEQHHLISRGDPVLIPYADFAGGAIQTAQIPYTVPSDARGLYYVQVYLRTGEIGGMVARGEIAPLMVTGGPDPEMVVTSEMHVTGSIESGPRIPVGGTSGTVPNSGFSGDFNANLKLGVAEPTYALTGSSVLNPTSRRLDPLFTLVPGSGNFDSPNAQTPAATSTATSTSAPLHYQDVLGPTTAALPALLFSGGETLRGLDSQVNQSGWTYQAALGFPQLASSTSGQQTGYLLDVGKGFSGSQIVHATYVEQIDDPYTFVSTNGGVPLLTQAGGLEFHQPFGPHFSLKAGGALSGIRPETVVGATSNDAADKGELDYAAGSSSVDAEYHNFGADFATGNGLGATSDSAGGSIAASLGLGPASSLALNYSHDYTRSAPTSNDYGGATLTLVPKSGLSLTLSGGQQHTVTTYTDTANKQGSVVMSSSKGSSTINLSGNLTANTDSTTPDNDGVTRSGQLQYALSRGATNLSVSLSALDNQISVPSSTFAETLVLSFPLGGHSVATTAGPARTPTFSSAHGFDFQLTAGNANTKLSSGEGSSTDLNLGAVLAYHLGLHVVLGVHALSDRHLDPVIPANDSTMSSLRVQMELQL
jgi:hypothetical protein